MDSPQKSWYAIYVKSRHEKSVHEKLLSKNIHAVLPLIEKLRRWSDRTKKVQEPLFRCYVFVQICLKEDKLNVLKTDGVVKFIGIGGHPSPIPDKQIHWIKILANEPGTVLVKDLIAVGKAVRVIAGPLKGLEGTVIKQKNKMRLVVAIESLNQSLAIEVNPELLEIKR